MRRFIVRGLLSATLLMIAAGSAFAWHVEGNVRCEGTGTAISGIDIRIQNTDGAPFDQTTTTDVNGYYFFWLPETPQCFRLTVQLGAGMTAVDPASGYYDFCTTNENFGFTRDFTIDSPACHSEGLCWLTGGGAKYSTLTQTNLGQIKTGNARFKVSNFGGNVYPGCSPTAGDGGQWNNIADDLKLHFQGFTGHVLRCGNVDGIEPGSESPVTPFNFIEWEGTGRVKGVQGNKADYPLVYYFIRCEDRNEPGSNGQRDGSEKDRYFLNVYTDPSNPTGSSIMLVDIDGNPATVDPLVITDGNLQIHISSCDSPPDFGVTALVPEDAGMQTLSPPTSDTADEPASLWFAAPRPSPASGNTTLRFSVPQASEVQLTVYDLMGREVAELMNGRAAAGMHTMSWDLRDGMGQAVSRGIYFLRLRVNGNVLNQRVTVMN